MRPRIRVVEDRLSDAGLRELLVGHGAGTLFGLRNGKQRRLGSQPWKIGGVLATGDAPASEIRAVAAMQAEVCRRGEWRSTATARLQSPAAGVRTSHA